MRKIRSILVDDNKFIVTVLSDLLLENHAEIEILGVAHNGQEGISLINDLKPELIFLDIEMPDMNGFDMLNQLEFKDFQTIFTTAYSHYAIKAFRFNALDYLVKPIDPSELAQSITRYKANKFSTNNRVHIEQALKNLQTPNVEEQAFFLPTYEGEIKMALKSIVRIEGERNYSYLFLLNGQKILSSKTLGYFEEILSDKGFFRCHRSHLVNRIHVTNMTNASEFVVKDETLVPISRRRKSEAKNWFLNSISC